MPDQEKQSLTSDRSTSPQREAELTALLEASRAVLESHDFESIARSIFDSCKQVIGATAGYVALLSADGATNELLFLEAGELPCTVDPSLAMPIRGLRAEAYGRGTTVYQNDFSNSEWVEYLPKGHVELRNALFAPLTIDGETVGVLGLANKPGDFTKNDVDLASAFGSLAAIGLRHSRSLEALESSEEQFRNLVQTATDAIISVDMHGKVVSWNDAAERVFGYSDREMGGKLITGIIPERFHKAHRRGLKRFLAGRGGKIIGKTIEVSGLRRDGSEVPLELSLATWKTGEEVYFTSIIRDITERHRLLAELQESEERFRVMFENANDMITIVDRGGGILWANPTWRDTLGLEPESVEDLFERVHPDDRIEVVRAWEALDAGEDSITIPSYRYRKADGGYACLETTVTSVSGRDQSFRYVVSVDITELVTLRREVGISQGVPGIVSRDPQMEETFEAIRKVAPTDVPVLITGESGTGKELVALAIHNESARADNRFVVVNCGSLPEDLLEGELFGHLKGAFTGALSDKKGAFESAAGGTVFLNGVEQLSPPLQVRLLRVLQNGTLERAGGETTIHVDARVICATNRNLKEDVTRGRFRQDLYYRISVVPIHLPALRKRPLDIPLLAQHTLDQETERLGRQRVSLSHQALSALINYPWPGNFSELQRCLIAALTEGSGEIIEKHDLASQVSQFGQPPLFSRARKRKLTEAMVAEALEKTAGNKVKAAKVLGVSRATLYRFLSQKRPV